MGLEQADFVHREEEPGGERLSVCGLGGEGLGGEGLGGEGPGGEGLGGEGPGGEGLGVCGPGGEGPGVCSLPSGTAPAASSGLAKRQTAPSRLHTCNNYLRRVHADRCMQELAVSSQGSCPDRPHVRFCPVGCPRLHARSMTAVVPCVTVVVVFLFIVLFSFFLSAWGGAASMSSHSNACTYLQHLCAPCGFLPT